ncbi:hypothetical protein [Sphingomonas sp. 37zxx]|uniref:hypothetical protein n=1 Tax=Sphingomonas sp. 37zxx TaxID=1550073 RepID=UPI000689E029|nr:hypothetical protein [Sphingomonas sp. 37zxx]
MNWENRSGLETQSFGFSEHPQPEYRVNLTIAVRDVEALWVAAAARLLSAPGMTLDDVIDVIGPQQDPAVEECIATVAKPTALPGCIMDDFWIDSMQGCPSRIEIADAIPQHWKPAVERGPWRAALARRPVATALCATPTPQDGAQPN